VGLQLIPGGHRVVLEVVAQELPFWQDMIASKRPLHIEALLEISTLATNDTNLKSLEGFYVADMLPKNDPAHLHVRLTSADSPRPVERRFEQGD
jgi:hypothetical protein